MTSGNQQKTYTLTPSWKQFFIAYVLSVLTIPLLVGIIALYYIRKKHNGIRYIISDTTIKAIGPKYEHHVDLVDIHQITLTKTWLQQQLGIGTLVLETSASEMELTGLKHPTRLQEMLEQAIQTEVQRQEEQQKSKPQKPEYKPGTMERIDYLTGLWQQGLISDADFEEERKHFE